MNEDNPRKILVIDDDAVIRIATEEYLDEAGFTVHEAVNGRLGLAAFPQVHPDLVLLDVEMPGMDGFAVCESLRALPGGEHTPILMMTGRDDSESVERAYRSGATDFVSKPVNYPLLAHRVRYLLRAKHTADRLRASERSLASAQRIAKLGNWTLDLSNRRFEHSEQVRSIILGVESREKLTLHRVLRAVEPSDRDRFRVLYRRCLRETQGYDIEYRVRGPAGVAVVHQHTEVQSDEAGRAVALRGTLQDVTERRNAEARIRELAYFDTITGLPNRTLFVEHLEQALEQGKRNRRHLSVLFIDLDRFKRVNDSFGHSVGDLLLHQVSTRLTESLRRCDVLSRNVALPYAGQGRSNTLARLGGDEFVVLLSEIRRPEDASTVARRIMNALDEPFIVEGSQIYVTASIGISTYPGDGDDADKLLKSADAAMYQVKSEGRSGFRFYTPETNSRAFERLSLETNLRRALERDEFSVHYQPRVDAPSERVVGMEALVRWNHPDLGLVSPAEFIPIAEETGLIIPLGEWVIATACRQTEEWRRAGLAGLRLSVNLSAVQFRGSSLLATVENALSIAQLDAASLELELTESMLIGDAEKGIGLMQSLREMGLSLSIDDFGTGYSSLGHLKRFPIQCLKIDRYFIRDIVSDRDDAALVRGVIHLAHSLGLKVVIEGVEDSEQRDCVSEYGCDEIQGYFYAQPLPAAEFASWVENHHGKLDQRAA